MDSDSDSSTRSEQSPEEDNKRAIIRKQLSKMSLEDIQKLKEKIGAKMYNEVVLGIKAKKPNTNFKRANKNRPREMSSKIRPRFEQTERTIQAVQSKRKPISRDPRFDSMCGEYDGKAFRENYKFVNDIRKNDKKELEKELSITVDPERKKQIRFLIQRLNNQIREAEKMENSEQQKLEERMEFREKRLKGEKPTFKRKSEKKIDELLHKYEELKKSSKLQKHIEKRQKKEKKKVS